MDHLRLPRKALLPARRAVDEELPGQASESIPGHYPGRLHSRQHFIVRLLSLLLQEDPSLPTSIDPRASTPPLISKIALGRRAEISAHNRTHGRLQSLFPANNDTLVVNERIEQGTEGGEDVDTNFSGSTSHSFDIRRTRHKKRISELKEYIKPISPEDGSAVILLCWGETSCCSVLPVSASNPEDEVATWREINAAWYTRKGHWRKRLMGLRVTRVAIAEITVLGLKEASSGTGTSEYIGMYLEQDIPKERKRLQHIIDCNPPTSHCFYSRETGTVHCDPECVCSQCFPNIDGIDDCPLKISRAARRELLLLDTLDLMRHVFSNPVLAASNDFLEQANLVYSHQ
ncbi:hypothetical protein ASPCAL14727 [Aspergillus calidoustus]|nr:hypothetical protein ASPCAL14727 [Aspergillus calidoustus]